MLPRELHGYHHSCQCVPVLQRRLAHLFCLVSCSGDRDQFDFDNYECERYEELVLYPEDYVQNISASLGLADQKIGNYWIHHEDSFILYLQNQT